MNVHAVNRIVDIDTLMASGITLASDPSTAVGALNRFVDHVIELEALPSACLDSKCVGYADSMLTDVFERGWQPAELIHVVERGIDKPVVPMITALLGAHSRRTRALSLAPQEWREQLRRLDIDPSTDLLHFRRSYRLDARTFWTSLFLLLAQFRQVGSIARICAPPSQWTECTAAVSGNLPDPKVLNKIRALLAKAESTTFAEEAETLSAKAQELMTRYALDTVVLDSAGPSPLGTLVMTRRILVDGPYTDAKMQMMASVAHANGVKTLRWKKFGLIGITGMPVDLDLCELLYTSLLVQSARALADVGTDARTRSRAFRRAFRFGYAWRIRERLIEARARADRSASETYGSSLVPILAERDSAVVSVYRATFPNTRPSRISVSDRGGVHQGRQAAEHADLTGGRERIEE